MNQDHHDVLDWIAQGRVRAGAEPDALRLAGLTPTPQQWWHFLDRMMLWLSALFGGAALIFFLAYNWHEMGRYAKFGLAQALLLMSLAACWRFDLQSAAGKACLFLATMLVGALLALVGQTYQTGADTYELFTAWALASFAWVVLAQLGALWLVWLVLLNLAVTLYFSTFGGMWGIVFGPQDQMWALFALNTVALLAWEAAAFLGIEHLRERWPVRVVASAGGVLLTTLMLYAIFDGGYQGARISAAGTFLAYAAWMAGAYFYYRHVLKDLFVLAGGVLSLVVVSNAMVAEALLHHSDAGGFLLIGVLIIGTSSLGGIWLKKIAKEMQA
jgi:uncharacterized membrane protein